MQKNCDDIEGDPTRNPAEKLQAVQKVVSAFVSAFKYYSLYPEGHTFSSNYLFRFKSELDEFLAEQKSLRLEISRNNFFYRDEPVTAGTADENNPAFLLSRDRILLLEFIKNIPLAEITLFLDILKRHRNPMEIEDGDIATTLWHNRFDHIHYEAADIFAMEAIQFDLSMFRSAPGLEPSGGRGNSEGDAAGQAPGFPEGEGGAQGAGGRITPGSPPGGYAHYSRPGGDAGGPPSSILFLQTNKGLGELEPEEQKQLERQVMQEEVRSYSTDVIDILLITLAVEENSFDFAAVLEFLEAEYFDAMQKEEFSLAFKIVRNVMNIHEAIKVKKPWSSALVDLFCSALTREDRYITMEWQKEYRRLAADPEKNEILLKTLESLPADIVLVLGKLLAQVPADRFDLRCKIVDSIADKVNGNSHPLCRLVAESDEDTNRLLLLVAEQLQNEDAAPVYLAMTRHPAPQVRKAGMDGFFRTCSAPQASQIAHLMEEPDCQLRDRVLAYVNQLDSRVREEVLVSFLDRDSASVDDELYILNCYRLLAGCCTGRSVEFLGKVLLESDLRSMFSHLRKAHRTGAAYVLKTVGTKDAMIVLGKGAESIWPDVRQICRRALVS